MWNVHQAKTHLSFLLRRVRSGEEVVIANRGVPVAKLVPFEPAPERRRPGAWRGRVHVAPDFDELPAEIAAAFDGRARD